MGSFNRLNSEDVSISTDKVVSNTWSGDTDILLTHLTSSNTVFTSATSQGNFFIEVYGSSTITSATPVEYAVSYGHKTGLGSENFTNVSGALGNTATKCIYNQYRQLVFGDENSEFTFNGVVSNDIYVININRARYKHALKPGSLNLEISDGSNLTKLTDDSITTTGSSTITNLGRQYNLVSGSDGSMSGSTLNQSGPGSGSYGFVYPEAGIIVLNGLALRGRNATSAAYWVEGSTYTAQKLGQKIQTAISRSSNFQLDSEEKISSQYHFVRIKNSEYNYSSNPSYIDANGNLNNTTFTDSPVTYVTTVGLYNDDNNLLAVAKLSQPLKKDFTTEALLRIKLDY
jgi:hypothetical protein|tara:strand:- start:3689 stop:4720 length:1032 start_codon:yes stop_codon:yes gene_type:complete